MKSFYKILKENILWNFKWNYFMKFQIKSFYEIPEIILWNLNYHIFKTALYIAVEKENVEIVQLLLNQENIDINMKSIFHLKFYKIFKSNILLHSK